MQAHNPQPDPRQTRPNLWPAGQPPESEPIAGRYELMEQIGSGGFSITYRARDTVLGRTVALKMLLSQFAREETFVSRFEREARAAASVSHPNIVDVYDFGPHDDTFFIVMQYVPGRDLKREVSERGPLDPAETVRIGRQILRGLGAIHAAGIIHRDIKPQNVLLSDDGVARVTDFGVAHIAVDGSLTSHGTTVGSASYMAPEQARGGDLSQATDLYAVGVVLYELLTGRLPFEASNPMAVMLAHVQTAPPTLSEVAPERAIPPALETAIMRALAKDPAARFTNAAEMADALDTAVGASDAPRRPTRIVASPAREATATMPLQTTPPEVVLATPAPTSAAAAPPRPSEQRRDRGWRAPLLMFGLALALLGGAIGYTVLAGGGNGSGNNGEPARGAIGGIGPTETALAAQDDPTETPEPTPTEPEPTDTPVPTETPVPTATAPATATATATATNTPAPTATATPTPTETSAPVEPDPEEDAPAGIGQPTDEPPTIAPSGNAASASQAGLGSSGGMLTFAASDWDGGHFQETGYGRPWTAIYGADSGLDRATLTFTLAEAPAGEVLFTVTGLDDEIRGNVPIAIEINGQRVYENPSPFNSWDGREGSWPWKQVQAPLPSNLFDAGENEIAVLNLAPSENIGLPPYVLLSDASLEVRNSSTVGSLQLSAAANPEPADNSNRGRGSGDRDAKEQEKAEREAEKEAEKERKEAEKAREKAEKDKDDDD